MSGVFGWQTRLRVTNGVGSFLICSRAKCSDKVFEPTPHQLDWVEVGRVGGQKQQLASGLFHGLLQGAPVVDARVVHNQNASRWNQRQEGFLDKEGEQRPCPNNAPVQAPTRCHNAHKPLGLAPLGLAPLGSEKAPTHERLGPLAVGPLLERHALAQAPAADEPAIQSVQVEREPALIQKHQPVRVEALYCVEEGCTLVFVSFKGETALFLKRPPRRFKWS